MKKIIFLLLIFSCVMTAYAKTIPLQSEINANNEIILKNAKFIVKDKLRIGNDTETPIEVIIKGTELLLVVSNIIILIISMKMQL